MSIQANHLKKSYKKRTVVDNVTLKVDKGEIVGLLGPNGAGKTTTFYMIVGIVKSDEGSVVLNDSDITHDAIHTRAKRGIGYLPQEPSVFRKLTVYENIAAAIQLKFPSKTKTRSGKRMIRERVEKLIEDFGLEKVVDSYGYSLSGGERRRVEIARCMSIDPEFILLDEPFAGIDPISVADIQNMIFKLKEMGIGVLITDHNVRETLKITDRGYIIYEGNVLTEGVPEEIISHREVINRYLGEGFYL